jgi:hypothetical protein
VVDINFYTLHIAENLDRDHLPGFMTMQPPRRTARGRENDLLIALITLKGPASISPESLRSWMEKKCEEYFQTAGTVTLAMRTLVEKLNNDLLQRNLKRAKDGAPMTALLNLAVVKRDQLYLASVGNTRAFYIAAEDCSEYRDDEHPRDLGTNETPTIKFGQKAIVANDLLLFAPVAPATWTSEAFAGGNALTIEGLSRRLFNQSGADLRAVAMKFLPGKGALSTRPLKREFSTTAIPDSAYFTAAAPQFAENAQAQPAADAPRPLIDPPQPLEQPLESTRASRSGSSRSAQSERAAVASELLSPETKLAIGKKTRAAVEGWEGFWQKAGGLMGKLIPGLTEGPARLNKPALIFIAVAVPLIIALIAGGVYSKKGKGREFDAALVQAQQYAAQAEVLVNDPPSRLATLQQAMYWIDRAEEYGTSDTFVTLKSNVQNALDQLQGGQRLEMAPLFARTLPSNTRITQMVATNTEVYLLDETSGTVLRYYRSGDEYLQDTAFDCGYNPKNPLSPIGKLVDIIPVAPGNSFEATIMGIDSAGVFEYCVPNETGITGSLIPPDAGWVSLKALAIYQGYLYILDSGGNAVYRYAGDGIQYEEKPTLFFDKVVPDLADAFDIEVNGFELYILKNNSQMIACTYSPLKDYKETECLDPAPFGDMRTAQDPQPITFSNAKFVQERLTPAPDSSLYLLDAQGKSIYHFSLQRNLQKILYPRLMDDTNIDNVTPTAVAISTGRIVYMAFGNLVYYAPLP